MSVTLDPPYSANGDRIAQLRFDCIAAKIEREPGLLAIPLANIARWLAQAHPARERLQGWQQLITEARHSETGMSRLCGLLCSDDADANQWKAFSPFAGVLTRDELIHLRWTSRH